MDKTKPHEALSGRPIAKKVLAKDATSLGLAIPSRGIEVNWGSSREAGRVE